MTQPHPYKFGQLLQRLAADIDATIDLDPNWKVAGCITFRSGNISYFRLNSLDINGQGSAALAKDKDYTNYFLQQRGYPTVPDSRAFYSPEWSRHLGVPDNSYQQAAAHAVHIGFPVIIKPNSESHGRAVAIAHTEAELHTALQAAFYLDRVVLVQQWLSGRDYRVVVFDNVVVAAYERTPLQITGNGHDSIATLLQQKQETLTATGRVAAITADVRIEQYLDHLGHTQQTVLPTGIVLPLLPNANLSAGGDAIDVTTDLHDDFKQLAINTTKDMGLRLCGVDLMIDGDGCYSHDTVHILELNAAPGLDNYAKLGPVQQTVVENLYKSVLRAMEH